MQQITVTVNHHELNTACLERFMKLPDIDTMILFTGLAKLVQDTYNAGLHGKPLQPIRYLSINKSPLCQPSKANAQRAPIATKV